MPSFVPAKADFLQRSFGGISLYHHQGAAVQYTALYEQKDPLVEEVCWVFAVRLQLQISLRIEPLYTLQAM